MRDASHGAGPVIRGAVPGDIDCLVAIETGAFATDRISARSFRRQMRSPTLGLLVAENGGIVHGYALVSFRRGSRKARIYSLAVDATEGRGLGRALMNACEELGRSRRCDTIRLEVNESNTRAIGIYERAGYACVGERKDYYEDGATARLYAKRLTSP